MMLNPLNSSCLLSISVMLISMKAGAAAGQALVVDSGADGGEDDVSVHVELTLVAMYAGTELDGWIACVCEVSVGNDDDTE